VLIHSRCEFFFFKKNVRLEYTTMQQKTAALTSNTHWSAHLHQRGNGGSSHQWVRVVARCRRKNNLGTNEQEMVESRTKAENIVMSKEMDLGRVN